MYFAVFDLELASSYLSICLCSCAQQTPSRYLSLFNDSSAIIQNRKLVHFQIRWNMEIMRRIDIWTRRGQASGISCKLSRENPPTPQKIRNKSIKLSEGNPKKLGRMNVEWGRAEKGRGQPSGISWLVKTKIGTRLATRSHLCKRF